jgi:hypothetical protein
MWTSGRLVNVWNQPRKSRDVKDIYVCVHTGNIPQTRGYFWNVKVPSSPYNRGREGKGFTTFEASTGFQRFFVSLLQFLWLVFLTLVFGDFIWYSNPPTPAPTAPGTAVSHCRPHLRPPLLTTSAPSPRCWPIRLPQLHTSSCWSAYCHRPPLYG